MQSFQSFNCKFRLRRKFAEYELKTWQTPNNFAIKPVVNRGILYLGINYAPGMRDKMGKKSVEDYLESGGDPAAVFKFIVIDVASHQ